MESRVSCGAAGAAGTENDVLRVACPPRHVLGSAPGVGNGAELSSWDGAAEAVEWFVKLGKTQAELGFFPMNPRAGNRLGWSHARKGGRRGPRDRANSNHKKQHERQSSDRDQRRGASRGPGDDYLSSPTQSDRRRRLGADRSHPRAVPSSACQSGGGSDGGADPASDPPGSNDDRRTIEG